MSSNHPDKILAQFILERCLQERVIEASVTYQMLIARGERKVLLRQGRKLFGPPEEAVLAHLETLEDPAEVERLADRLLDVSSWQELLATPTS